MMAQTKIVNNHGEWQALTLALDTLNEQDHTIDEKREKQLIQGLLKILDDNKANISAITTIGLFFELLLEDYQPLSNYLDENINDLTSIIALLIKVSFADFEAANQQAIKELIEGGFRLGNHRIRILKACTSNMEPAARQKALAIEKSLLTRNKQSEEIIMKVSNYVKENGKVNQKVIAADLGISQPTVSRVLKNYIHE